MNRIVIGNFKFVSYHEMGKIQNDSNRTNMTERFKKRKMLIEYSLCWISGFSVVASWNEKKDKTKPKNKKKKQRNERVLLLGISLFISF